MIVWMFEINFEDFLDGPVHNHLTSKEIELVARFSFLPQRNINGVKFAKPISSQVKFLVIKKLIVTWLAR